MTIAFDSGPEDAEATGSCSTWKALAGLPV